MSIVLDEVYEEDGAIVFREACRLGCEGIVSKRLGSMYRRGRSPHWVKVKNPRAPAVTREAEEDWGESHSVMAITENLSRSAKDCGVAGWRTARRSDVKVCCFFGVGQRFRDRGRDYGANSSPIDRTQGSSRKFSSQLRGRSLAIRQPGLMPRRFSAIRPAAGLLFVSEATGPTNPPVFVIPLFS
jgi:hypothetical protein